MHTFRTLQLPLLPTSVELFLLYSPGHNSLLCVFQCIIPSTILQLKIIHSYKTKQTPQNCSTHHRSPSTFSFNYQLQKELLQLFLFLWGETLQNRPSASQTYHPFWFPSYTFVSSILWLSVLVSAGLNFPFLEDPCWLSLALLLISQLPYPPPPVFFILRRGGMFVFSPPLLRPDVT